jgi:hypothetical protein
MVPIRKQERQRRNERRVPALDERMYSFDELMPASFGA